MTFPGRIWAMLLYGDKEQMQTFTAAPEAAEAPKVNFN